MVLEFPGVTRKNMSGLLGVGGECDSKKQVEKHCSRKRVHQVLSISENDPFFKQGQDPLNVN